MHRNCHPYLPITLALAAPVAAQNLTWDEALPSPPTPGSRSASAFAYDSQRGRTVLFGGQQFQQLGDTWEWDGFTWTQVATPGPGVRTRSAMVYDSQRGVCVLFGGMSSNVLTTDTWEWDGNTWTQVATTGPTPRIEHAMAYDSQRGRTVLYGGRPQTSGTTILTDTWEWDGNTWILRSPGSAATGPGLRSHHAMAYDSQRGRTVLFGGFIGSGVYSPNDTWEWDGKDWFQVATVGPSARREFGLAYDSYRGVSVLFGGIGSGGRQGDTWEWDGSSWLLATQTGPSARYGSRMAYDSQARATVLFGGADNLVRGDTWIYTAPATITKFGAPCSGSGNGTPCREGNTNPGPLALAQAPVEYGIVVTATQPTPISSFDIYTCSTGGMQTVLAHVYSVPQGVSLGSITMTIGPTADYYTATFPAPITPGVGAFMIAFDISAQNVVLPELVQGTWGPIGTRTPGGIWQYGTASTSWRIHCASTPVIHHSGTPRVGASYGVTLSESLPNTMAVLMTGFSNTSYGSTPLPLTIPATNSCWLLVAPEFLASTTTSSAGAATEWIAVPPSTAHVGVQLFHQWAVFDPVNALGIITTEGAEATVGL